MFWKKHSRRRRAKSYFVAKGTAAQLFRKSLRGSSFRSVGHLTILTSSALSSRRSVMNPVFSAVTAAQERKTFPGGSNDPAGLMVNRRPKGFLPRYARPLPAVSTHNRRVSRFSSSGSVRTPSHPFSVSAVHPRSMPPSPAYGLGASSVTTRMSDNPWLGLQQRALAPYRQPSLRKLDAARPSPVAIR